MRIRGVARDNDALTVYFDDRPSVDGMRDVHELLRCLDGGEPLARRVQSALQIICQRETGHKDWMAAADAALDAMSVRN